MVGRFHISFSTYGTWLPGDRRGFRSRRHRLHVDGDYVNPPPEGKFDRLHRHAKSLLKRSPIILSQQLRGAVGMACVEQAEKENTVLHAIAVGGQHVHVALQCRQDGIKQLIGRVKKVSSHRIRDRIPGRVWGAGCHVVPVRDAKHWQNVLNYLQGHNRNCWVWIRP